MNLRHLRYFVTIADELHFRRAAERLNLSQPALTRAIQQLEFVTGCPLVRRDSRHVELTVAGEELLKGARTVLATLQSTTERARRAESGETGLVRIGYTDIAVAGILPTVVRSFRASLPGVAVEANHGCTQAQIDALASGQLDVGFLTGPWSREGFAAWTVQQDGFVAVLPKHHPLAATHALALSDLAEEPFVLGEPRFWTHYHAHLFAACRATGFEPKVVQYASNNEGILGLVACGMGVSVQAESISIYARRDVVIRRLRSLTVKVPTIAAWRCDGMSAPKARLIAHLKALYRNPAKAPRRREPRAVAAA